MRNLILRSRKNVFRNETEILVSRYGFKEINNGVSSKGIKTHLENVVFYMKDIFFVLKNIPSINNTNILIVFGYNAIIVKLLEKLGIIRFKQLIWFGFFIHSDKAFKIFKFLLKRLNVKNEKIVINAEYEVNLYAQRLQLDENKFAVFSPGDWKEVNLNNITKPTYEKYYFAGGYTNRNYATLISVFKNIPANLVIVGSKLNKDLNDVNLPPNIEIRKDIDKVEFESLIKNSCACILPIRDDKAGASGHMVLLAYMRNKKVVIAPNFSAIKEYVVDKYSALLYENLESDLPELIKEIDTGEYNIEEIGKNAFETYKRSFTYNALSQKLIEIVFN